MGTMILTRGWKTQCIVRSNAPSLANVIDLNTGKPLGDGLPKISMEWDGRKIGFVGLVEECWIYLLGTVDPKYLEYHDFV